MNNKYIYRSLNVKARYMCQIDNIEKKLKKNFMGVPVYHINLRIHLKPVLEISPVLLS